MMNWKQAVEKMREGHQLQRESEQYRRQLDDNTFECGVEPCELAHAWTVDDKPVLVFRGAQSRVLYIPDIDDQEATDWVVVE